MVKAKYAALVGDLGSTLVLTFLARAIAAFGAVAMSIAIARQFDARALGAFAVAQAVIVGATTVACRGADSALTRFIGAQDEALPFLSNWGLRRVFFLSALLAFLVAIFSSQVEVQFKVSGLGEILFAMCGSIPALALSTLTAGIMKGARRPAIACLLENGAVYLIAAIAITVYSVLGKASIADAGWCFAAASWAIALCALTVLKVEVSKRARCETPPIDLSLVKDSANNFFVVGIAGLVNSVLFVFVAALVLTARDVGLLKAAQQVSVVIGFILVVLTAILPPHFARLASSSSTDELERLAQRGALISMVLAAPMLVVFMAAPTMILLVFGSGFQQASVALQILAAAQFVNVATGPVGYLLAMAGNEGLWRNLVLTTSIVAIFGLSALGQRFGLVGAAAAIALSIAFQNAAAVYFAWSRLGVWTIPAPNLLRAFGVRGGGAVRPEESDE